MNWSQTKMIFLVAFLILDVYLGYQLYEKRGATNQLPTATSNTPPKKALAKAQIQLPSSLPHETTDTYISGKKMSFVRPGSSEQSGNGKSGKAHSDKKTSSKNKKVLKPEILQLEARTQQDINPENGGKEIYSTFKTPYPIPEQPSTDDVKNFLKKYIYHGMEYRFWKKRSENMGSVTFIFVQTYKGHPVFSKGNSDTGMLQVYASDGKITGYRQSYLKLSPFNKKNKKNLINPIKAVDILYENDDILKRSTVKEVALSYFNIIANPEKIRLFGPTWYIVVETGENQDKKEFFVNAIKGQIQTLTPPDQSTEPTGGSAK